MPNHLLICAARRRAAQADTAALMLRTRVFAQIRAVELAARPPEARGVALVPYDPGFAAWQHRRGSVEGRMQRFLARVQARNAEGRR